MNQYIPALLTFAAGAGVAAAMLGLSQFFGPKHEFREKMEPFECGENQVVSPKRRFSVRFYLIAMMFIVFDIEAVFLFPWAVVFRALGWFGFVEMMTFLLVLAVGLVYVWKKGALEWE
jgi:NADH-quinone oxidoreductase subunit A